MLNNVGLNNGLEYNSNFPIVPIVGTVAAIAVALCILKNCNNSNENRVNNGPMEIGDIVPNRAPLSEEQIERRRAMFLEFSGGSWVNQS